MKKIFDAIFNSIVFIAKYGFFILAVSSLAYCFRIFPSETLPLWANTYIGIIFIYILFEIFRVFLTSSVKYKEINIPLWLRVTIVIINLMIIAIHLRG